MSKLEVYSIGIVAANKALDSKQIEVIPIEDLPMADGELSDNVADTSSKAVDTEGAAYETQVAATLTVQATWLPFGNANRQTAPDVRRGEHVILYRFANQDKFWWVSTGQDMRLRKLETVIWGISATQDEGVDPSPENMYWMEWSSHIGMIHIHTSKANKEPFAYDLQLNTKEGVFIFQDDDGQKFSLDSQGRTWRVENRDGSYVEINKREIYEHAPDLIRRTAKRIEDIADESIKVHAGQTIDTDAGKAISTQAGQTITSTAGTHISETAPTIGIAGETTIDGGISATKTMVVAGDIAAGGEAGVSLLHHVHPENDHGGPTGTAIPGTSTASGAGGGA